MEELLSFFSSDHDINDTDNRQQSLSSRTAITPTDSDWQVSNSDSFQQEELAESQCDSSLSGDPLTGLRIADRCTSRADMLQAFSPLFFQSCSKLAAASHVDWSGYLVKPGKNATIPNGTTNLVTCGVLIADVSSKLSQTTGRAFAILQLGDLPSSLHSYHRPSAAAYGTIYASLSVFLFGDALRVLANNHTGRHCLRAGYAVAVLAPTLLPPRTDKQAAGESSTSVSLSVNDPKQILVIGRCIDCDRCQGTTRKRINRNDGFSTDGKWQEGRCGTMVDLRLGGPFCHMHRKQGIPSSGKQGTTNTNGKKTSMAHLTFMQKQRRDNGTTPSKVILPIDGTKKLRKVDLGIASRTGMASNALSRAGFLDNSTSTLPSASMGIHSNAAAQYLKRAPLHMMQSNRYNSSSTATNCSKGTVPPKLDGGSHAQVAAKLSKSKKDCLEEAVQRKRQKTIQMSTVTLSKQSTNTVSNNIFHMEGYDGSVFVPKPNSILFARKSMTHSATVAVSPSIQMSSTNETQGILEKQKSLAGLLSNQINSSRVTSIVVGDNHVQHFGSDESISQAREDDPFGSLFRANDNTDSQSFDRDAIFKAKSRFSSAANAEEYARARSVVQQLEMKENELNHRKESIERMKGSSSNKNGKVGVMKQTATSAIVTTGWVCKTCKVKSEVKPFGCIRSGHDVRQQREVKDRKSALGSKKEQIDRHGKNENEGGLTLGSGLEWSGWKGYF